jgi:5-methyltetrahydrofolate--homocysteine methyltransferase
MGGEEGATGMSDRGSIVLATVSGDVHDIGKNIVKVILACNGFRVIDLGVMVPLEKIVETARTEKADMIGLSGLIAPSLDEMVCVAQEMERQHFETPLLIGGATTSTTHTAVKIAPAYHGITIRVPDATRAVTVASRLMNTDQRKTFGIETRDSQITLRQQYEVRQAKRDLISLDEARRKRLKTDWDNYRPVRPAELGVTIYDNCALDELVKYIDWTPFFNAWELAGRYPGILNDKVAGEQAVKLFDDAQSLLTTIVDQKLLQARAVVGLFPANAVDDDIVVYEDEKRGTVWQTLHMLRQQRRKPAGQVNSCLADLIAPADTEVSDYIGAFAVTAGHGVHELAAKFEQDDDDYNALMTQLLADRLAEALAEQTHELVRTSLWGYANRERLNNQELIAEKYIGIRPAPGYPACPDHTEKRQLFEMLDVEKATGIKLTASGAMAPGASISGWYFSHPKAIYFGVGRIGRDQVAAYAKRKGVTVADIEKALAIQLAYDPVSTESTRSETTPRTVASANKGSK